MPNQRASYEDGEDKELRSPLLEDFLGKVEIFTLQKGKHWPGAHDGLEMGYEMGLDSGGGPALLFTGRRHIKVAISLGLGLQLSRFISQFILLLGTVLEQLFHFCLFCLMY